MSNYEEIQKRLDIAFYELRKKGFLAKINFSCCQTCGVSALYKEAKELIDQGKSVKGYVFYHHQDQEELVETGHVYLAHGNFIELDPSALSSLKVAKAVCQALKKAGLLYKWKNSESWRILVNGIKEEELCPEQKD